MLNKHIHHTQYAQNVSNPLAEGVPRHGPVRMLKSRMKTKQFSYVFTPPFAALFVKTFLKNDKILFLNQKPQQILLYPLDYKTKQVL